jgi:diamine N-acetyltransferase
MTEFVYRDATAADASVLTALFADSFTETFGRLYKPEDLAAFLAGAGEAAWVDELSEPGLAARLVEEDGTPVAFAKVSGLTLPVETDRRALELRQLYVLKPWHGRGIAQELMEWALNRARQGGAEEVYLSVYVDNHRARRFYERYGFEFVKPYAFMVGTQADEDLILRLGLKETR